ncbi:MAG: hypothetical protein QE271_02495 [Bacteriovoracaceae bacterium]|nr:hypothetical protein [Bacteriovoracaceae bacterium]
MTEKKLPLQQLALNPISEKITLHQYIFDHISLANKKLYRPIHDIYLFYCAQLFEKYMTSEKFFSITSLGQLYLELQTPPAVSDEKQVFESSTSLPVKLQSLADTAFLTCAIFSESKKTKLLGLNYYSQICKNSYFQLNRLRPSYLDQPNFFFQYANHSPLVLTLLNDIKIDSDSNQIWQLFKSQMSA